MIKARGEASARGLGLRALHGCFPLKDRPAGDVLCLVDMPGDHGELRTQEIPFRHAGGSWTLLNSDDADLYPACPGVEEAQRAFRAIKKLDSLKVIDVDEEGQLVNERGRFEKVKAPWRLMCVYGVETRRTTMVGLYVLGRDGMDTKLTLKLDKEAIEQAKRYAERRGLSLSRVVESYFLRLAQSEEPPREKLTGVVAELAGVLKGAEISDPREEYTEYLRKKYS